MPEARHGKRAVHNWANLPPEVLRLVLANCLAYKPQVYPPSSWLYPEFYYQRCIFECLRDVQDVQRIMRVCPQWHNALIYIDFWAAACKVLDRQDLLRPKDFDITIQGGAAVVATGRLTRDYSRFCFLFQSCCLPCRINRPKTVDGIGSVKTVLSSVPFGYIPVCKGHRSAPFCGVCLMDYAIASRGDHNQLARVPESLFQNEDFDTWPGIHTTCFHCRRDALLKTVVAYSTEKVDLYSFIGGTSLESGDYEARSIVGSFVEMAEGSINDVINVLLERHWLHANTSLDSFLAQAVASVKFVRSNVSRVEGIETGYESEEEMLSDDDEESYDMLQSQEEGGIRDLAIAAWARSRILDGNWVTPTDMWFARTGQLPHDSDWNPSYITPSIHPVPYLLQSLQKDNDAMTCSTDSKEQHLHYPTADEHAPFPSYRFAQLAFTCFKSAFQGLLQEPLRYIVARLFSQARARGQDPCVLMAKITLDDVLGFLREERAWYINKGQGAQLQHAIPYIPISMENMSPMTRALLQTFWRDACQPFFACQCTICLRTMNKQADAKGVSDTTPMIPSAPRLHSPLVQIADTPCQIVLEDTPMSTADVPLHDDDTPSSPAISPSSQSSPPMSRKRSSAELDDPPDTPLPSSNASDSPRKRQRTGEKSVYGDDDTAMTSEPESPFLTDGGDNTTPGSPTQSPGLSSETGLSSSSASDSSSLRSVPSDEPLTGLTHKNRVVPLQLDVHKTNAGRVEIRGSDEEPDYGREGVVRFM